MRLNSTSPLIGRLVGRFVKKVSKIVKKEVSRFIHCLDFYATTQALDHTYKELSVARATLVSDENSLPIMQNSGWIIKNSRLVHHQTIPCGSQRICEELNE